MRAPIFERFADDECNFANASDEAFTFPANFMRLQCEVDDRTRRSKGPSGFSHATKLCCLVEESEWQSTKVNITRHCGT